MEERAVRSDPASATEMAGGDGWLRPRRLAVEEERG